MNPIHLPSFRLFPGMALSIDGTPGRVKLGTDGVVLLWVSDYPHGRKVIRIDDYMPSSAVLIAADPATGGCLAVLLGADVRRVHPASIFRAAEGMPWTDDLTCGFHATLGEACVAVAVALGRWPG
jgi:hypothetical protein